MKRLSPAQEKLILQASVAWTIRPYASAIRTADSLVKRGLAKYAEGPDRWGRNDWGSAGVMLTPAGHAMQKALNEEIDDRLCAEDERRAEGR